MDSNRSKSPPNRGDHTPVLALMAPLLLFTQGIMRWVDGLGSAGSLTAVSPTTSTTASATPAPGPLGIATAVVVVFAVAAACWLAVSLAQRLEQRALATGAVLVTAFGAGATAALALGHALGLIDGTAPSALAVGGPVLVVTGLGIALALLTRSGRMPLGSLGLAAVAVVVMAVPWDLVPLGSLLLLIALAPLTIDHAADRHQVAQERREARESRESRDQRAPDGHHAHGTSTAASAGRS